MEPVYAPGLRVVIRDAEWVVRRVDRTATGGQALTVTGVSQLVHDREAVFLTELDRNIEILNPADTRLVRDPSSGYRDAFLYMESQLRRTIPTDEQIHIGHRAAMDPVPYQLDPALLALQQPRQRILIADAVGLGKTLEGGILISELIRRGRGKRILVVAVKSMLTQFQKEMWSRFTIPLTRLDSVGIKRVREQIPTNHNPFLYYDKAIISVDTLKQQGEYRVYLEEAWWDIIVIDEAHNVAQRGGRFSQRARLARLLAGRSDTLIMLSATLLPIPTQPSHRIQRRLVPGPDPRRRSLARPGRRPGGKRPTRVIPLARDPRRLPRCLNPGLPGRYRRSGPPHP